MPDQALERVQQQIRLAPNSAALYEVLGGVHVARNEIEPAESAYLKAIGLEPRSFAAYLALGQLYARTKRYDEAQAKLDRALKVSPKDVRALMLTGVVQQARGDVPKARAAYEKIIAEDPSFGPAANNLAYLYSEYGGDREKALALAQNREGSDARESGGLRHARLDSLQARNLRSSLRLLFESGTKRPDNPEVQFHLGMAQYRMNDAGSGETESSTGFGTERQLSRQRSGSPNPLRASLMRGLSRCPALEGSMTVGADDGRCVCSRDLLRRARFLAFLLDRRSRVHAILAIGMIVLGFTEVCAGLGSGAHFLSDVLYWERLRLLAVAVLPGVWLLFSLSFARANARETIWRWKWIVGVFFVVPLGLATFFGADLFAIPREWNEFVVTVLPLGWSGRIFHLSVLLACVIVLMNLEATLRSASRYEALADQVHGARRGQLVRRPDLSGQPDAAVRPQSTCRSRRSNLTRYSLPPR